MTAIITGSGLGLFNTSADLLGGTGNSLVGRAGQSDAVYVNGTTGNLVIRAQDEFVSTAGLDTNLVRVYNSQGLLSDDNGDNWQFDFLSSLSAVTGTLNAVGSTITRKSGDGSTALYTCKTAGGPYISTDGSGADDTLAWNAGSSTWTRTDGDTRQQETFNASGVLLTALDRDGNVTTYNRTGTKVTSIVTGSGADTQTVYIDYNATNTNNIDAIRVVQGTTGGGTTQTLTRYYYDSQQRLSQVVVDLTPTTAATLQDANADGYWDTVNGQTYATRYTYETATNRRVASITQGDGSKISFTYDASGRVASYTDGENKLTTMSYASVAQTVPVSATVTATTTAPPAAWGAAALRESSGVGAWYARTAFAANGNGMAVWVQDPDLMVSYYTRATDSWSTPAAIDGAVTGNASAPSLTMSANGTALLTWVQNSNIYARRYVGGVWDNTSVTPLESLAGAALNPVGAINDSGRATIAFVQTDGTRNNLYVSNYTGSAWSAPAAIDDQGGANNNAIASTMAPSVSVDASGNAALAWLQKVGAEANDSLYYARYDALANSWSNPDAAALESTTAAVTAAQLSLDGNGDGVAVFVQGGALYARTYTLASNSWGAASTLAASGVTGAPSLAMSANGQAAVGWLNGGNAFVAIYAGGAWGAGTAVENLAGAAINQSVAINDSGQAAVLIVQSNGTANHVYANRYVNGAWSAGATALESNTNAMSTTAVPLASLDKLGNLTVLWGQKAASGDSGESIYSARYNNDTTPYYTTVSADTTWATIAQNVYGDSTAATALQAALGGIAVPAVGTKLRVPPRLDYTKSLTLNKVDITDALAQVTTFVSDASGRLVQVLSPTVGGVRLATSYVYDTAGNVVEVIDGNGNVVTSTYDTADNLLTRRDALGNTVAYTYSSANQVLTQTLYTVADPDGAGAGQPGGAMTTRYVYDAENHLRFSISAEGRVTESAYNANGTLATQVAYTANLYTTAGTPTETNMAAWVTAITDRTKAERVDYVYDFRGNISQATEWATVDAAGVGVADGNQSTTQYVYDQRGLLLQTIDARGSATTPNAATPNLNYATTYTYDGFGRRLTATRWVSATELRTVLTTSYDDVGNMAVATLANGLATTSVYDKRGMLLSNTQAALFGTLRRVLGTSSFKYDADGQLRISIDPLGNRTHMLYDAAGRMVASVDATGAMVETVYDSASNVVGTIAYANRLSAAQMALLANAVGDPLNPALASVRPTADAANDRVVRSVFDAANRLVMAITSHDTDATQGYVTQYFYDGAGRQTDVVEYARAISLTGLPAVPTQASVVARIGVSGGDRHSRAFYDNDGTVLGALDGEGYLTEDQYNAAGELVHAVTYATAALASLRDTAGFTQLKASAGTGANDQHLYFFYDRKGRQVAQLDAEGYLTESTYDAAGNVTQQTRYYNKANAYTGTQTVAQLRPAAHADDAVTTTWYNGANQVRYVKSMPSGTTTYYIYDSMGQLIQTERGWESDSFADASDVRYTQTRYDAQGRVVQELSANGMAALIALGGSPSQSQIDAIWSQYAVSYTYDKAGRRLTATDQNGNRTAYYYDGDGRVTHTINALGEVTETRYNAFGDITDTFAYTARLTAPAWSPANLREALTTADAVGAQMDFDAQGNGMAVWVLGADLYASVYTKATDSWSAAAALDLAGGGNPGSPHLSMSANGNALVTWVQNNDIHARRYVAGAWDNAALVPIESSAQTALNPVGSINDAGQAVVAFVMSDGTRNNVYAASCNGGTWAAPVAVDDIGTANNNAIAATTMPGAIIDGAGNATVIWLQAKGAEAFNSLFSSRLSAATGTWSAPVERDDTASATGVTSAQIKVAASGNAYVVFAQGGALNNRSYFAATDTWGTLGVTGTVTGAFSMDLSASGNIAIAWVSAASTVLARVYVNGAWTSAGTAVGGLSGTMGNVSVSVNDAGEAAVAFVQNNGTVNHVYANRFAQRAWQASASALESNPNGVSAAMTPSVAIDTQGNMQAVWLQKSGAETTDSVYSARYDSWAGGTMGAGLKNAITALANASLDAHDTVNYTLRGAVKAAVDSLSKSTGFSYDAFGEVVSRTDPIAAGVTSISTTAYDHRGLAVSTVQDTDNGAYVGIKRTGSAVYDAFGRVVQTTDGNGVSRSVAYDRLGRAITLTGPFGSRTTTYDAFSRTLTQADELGNTVATYAYNDAARSYTVTTGEGVAVTTAFNRHGQTLSVVDGNSKTTVLTYDKDGNLTNTRTDSGGLNLDNSIVYDKAGRVLRTVNARGISTAYGYDAADRVLTIKVDPRTVVTANDNPNGLEITTSYAYDGQGRTLTVTDAVGAVTQTTYDANGQVTQVAQDPAGLNLVTRLTYDDQGRQLSVTAGFGTAAASTVSYVYDRMGRLLEKHVDPSGLNLVTSYAYDGNDNVVAVTDARGNVTRHYYDADNRKIYTLSPLNELVQTLYDAKGRVVQQTAYATPLTGGSFPVSPTVPTAAQIASRAAVIKSATSDQSTTFVYDKDDRLVYSYNGLGEVTQNVYDGAGNVTKSVRYATRIAVPATPPTLATMPAVTANSALDQASYAVYDAANRLVYSFNALGEVAKNEYDASGHVTRTTHYATRLASVPATPPTLLTMPAVTAAPALDRVECAVYDADGRVVYAYNALGEVTKNEYDGNGNVVKSVRYATRITPPATPPTLATMPAVTVNTALDSAAYMVYDTAGRLVYSYNAAGEVTKNEYDADGNVIRRTSYATRITPPLITPTLATMPAVTANATLDQVFFGVYDAANRLVYSFNAAGEVTKNEYDAGGNAVRSTRYATRITPPATPPTLATMPAVTASATDDMASYAVFDADNRLVYSFNAAGEVTQNVYDGQGNLVKTTVYATRITPPATPPTLATMPAVTVNATLDQSAYSVYDSAGRRVYAFNAAGEVTKTDYDGAGNVAKVTRYATRITAPATPPTLAGMPAVTANAALDQVETAVYDAAGRVAMSYDALGNLTRSTYDGKGNLLTVTDARGAVTSSVYDAADRQTRRTDALGNVTEYKYDAKGHVTQAIDALAAPLGNADNLVAGDGYYIAMREALGIVYQLGDTGQTTANLGKGKAALHLSAAEKTKLAALVTTVTYYDNTDRTVMVVDKGGYVTRSVYTATGQLQSQTLYGTALAGAARPADPAVLPSPVANAAIDRTTGYAYDKAGRLVTRTDAEGFQTQYVYDAAGHRTQTKQALDVAATLLATSYCYYDKAGNEAWLLSAEGYLTKQDFTAQGQPQTLTVYDTPVTAPASGNPVPAVGDTFHVTSYTYDKAGRLSRETNQPTSSAASQIFTDYTYDATGNQLSVVDAVGTADVRTIQRVYDAAGRLTDVIDGTGVATHYALDAMGDTRIKYEAFGRPEQRATLYVRDVLGRVVTETNAVGAQSATVYDVDGNIRQVTEAAGTSDARIGRMSYDVLGRMVSEENNSTAETTFYTYNAAGDRVSLTNANYLALTGLNDGPSVAGSTVTGYYVDLRKRLGVYYRAGDPGQTAANLGLGKLAADLTQADKDLLKARSTVSYVYNRVGLLAQATDDAGTVTVYTYDGAGNKLTATQAYDAVGNSNGQERVTIYTYDKDNRLKTVTGPQATPTDTPVYVTSYQYDALDNVTRITDAKGNLRINTYDLMGRLTASTYGGAATAATDIKTSYTYDARSNIASTTLSLRDDSDARTSRYRYDNADRQTCVIDGEGFGTVIAYDAFGNQKTVTAGQYLLVSTDAGYNATRVSLGASVTSSFTYDGIDHMTSMTDGVGSTTRYGYDKRGNRTLMDQAANRLNGTIARSTTYQYDKSNRVIQVDTQGGSRTAYAYDKVGNRIAEWTLQSMDYTSYGVPWTMQAQQYYGTDVVADRLSESAVPHQSGNSQLSDLPASLINTVSVSVTVPGYYVVPSYPGGTTQAAMWADIATTLYGDASMGPALMQNMGSPALAAGARLANLPTPLTRTDTGTNPPTVVSRTLNAGALSVTETQDVTTTYYLDLGQLSGVVSILKRFEYDTNRNLTAEIDPYGTRTEHDYDLVGNVLAHRYAAGTADERSVKMEYNFQNWKTADIDGYGARTTYEYDKLGNQTKITDALGKIARYYYDKANMLAAVLDPEGYVTKFQYDAAGNRTQETASALKFTGTISDTTAPTPSVNAADRTASLAYDRANQLVSRTEADGTRTDTLYNGAGKVVREWVNANAAYYTVPATPPTWQAIANTLYGVNSAAAGTALQTAVGGGASPVGNSKLTPLPAMLTIAGTPPATYYLKTFTGGARTRSYSYDADGRMATFTDVDTSVVTYTYDGANNRIKEVTTSSSTIEPDPNNRTRTTLFTYDLNNRRTLERAQGLDGVRVAEKFFEYDAVGNLLRQGIGPRDAHIDENYIYGGRFVQFQEYDLDNRVVRQGPEVWDSSTSSQVPVAQYSYDKAGNRVNSTDGNGKVTTYVYDLNNRVVREVKPQVSDYTVAGGARTESPATATVYDAAGNVVQVVTGSLFGSTHTVSATSSNTGGTGTSTVAVTVVLSTTAGTGEVANMGVGGLRMAYRSAGSTGAYTDVAVPVTGTAGTYKSANISLAVGSWEIKVYYLDTLGREVTVETQTLKTGASTTSYAASSSFTADYRATRWYDGNGQLLKELNADNALYVYTYTAFGAIESKTEYMTRLAPTDQNPAVSPSPPGGTSRLTSYLYDLAGRLVKLTRPAVAVTTLSGTSGSTPTASSATLTLAEVHNYDIYGDEVETIIGDNTATTGTVEGDRAVSYYDAKHRKVAMMDALGYLVEWDYDQQGNRIAQRTYTQPIASPSSVVPATRPTAPTAPAGQETVYLSNFYFDAANNLVKEVKPQIAVLDPASPGTGVSPATTLIRPTTTYTYDLGSHMLTKTDGAGTPAAATEYYGYDEAGRQSYFIDHNRVVRTFQYDAAGNLTSRTRWYAAMPEAYQGAYYNDYLSWSDNVVWELKNTTSYDASRNQTQTFTYDALNRVTSQTDAMGAGSADDLVQSYRYDAAGNRTYLKNEDGYVTQTAYDGKALIVQSTSALTEAGGVLTATDATSGTYFQYDVAGNVILAYTGKTANAAPLAVPGAAGENAAGGITVNWTVTPTGSQSTAPQSWVVYGTASHIGAGFAAGDLATYSASTASQTGAGARSASIGQYAPGTVLYWRVVTQDTAGNLAWTAEQTMAVPARFTALSIVQPTATSMTVTATFETGVSAPKFQYGAAGLSTPTTVNFVQQGSSNVWVASIASIASPGTLSYRVQWTSNSKTYNSAEAKFALAADRVGITSSVSATQVGSTGTYTMGVVTAIPTAFATGLTLQAQWRISGSSSGYAVAAVGAGGTSAGLSTYNLTLGSGTALAAGTYEVVLTGVRADGSTVVLDRFNYDVNAGSTLSTQQSVDWQAPTGSAQVVILNGLQAVGTRENAGARTMIDVQPAIANGASQGYLAMYGTLQGTTHTTTVTSATPGAGTSNVTVSTSFNSAETSAIAAGTGGLHVAWKVSGTGTTFGTDVGPITVTSNVGATTLSGLSTASTYDIKVYYVNSAGQEVVVEWQRIAPNVGSKAYSGKSLNVAGKEAGTLARDAAGLFSMTPGVYNGDVGVADLLGALTLTPDVTAGANTNGTAGTDGLSTGYFTENTYDARNVKIQSNEKDGLFRKYGVDANGYVVSTSLYGTIRPGDPGANASPILSYTQVDARGRTLKQFDPLVTVGGASVRPISTYGYDALDRVTSTKGPSASAATTYEYNAMGDRIKEIDPVDGSGKPKRTFVDQFGNVAAVITPGGSAASTGYASGYMTRNFYDTMGNLVKQIDPNGNTITFQYDLFGRKIAETDGRGQAVLAGFTHQISTASTNTASGAPWVERTDWTISTTLTAAEKAVVGTGGLHLRYRTAPSDPYFASAGLAWTDVVVPNTTGNTFSVVLGSLGSGSYELALYYVDTQGREVQVDARTAATTTSSQVLSSATSFLSGDYTIRYVYDNRNRLVAQQQAQGWHLAYDNAQAYKDERSRLGYPADIVATPLTQTQRDQLIALYTVSYAYDGRNNRTQTTAKAATSGNTQATVQAYDGMSRVIRTDRVVNTQLASKRVAYDVYGNIIGETDEMGRQKSSVYGVFARVKQATDEDGVVVNYDYNDYGQLIREYSAADNGATKDIVRTYDNMGRLLTISTTFDGKTSERALTTYTYRADGLRATEVTSAGLSGINSRNITYTYDDLGRLTRWADSAASMWGVHENYAYDADGNRTEVFTDTGWNPLGESTGGSTNWRKYDHVYTFDAGGRLLKEVDRKTSSTGVNTDTILAQYTYDAANNRLTYRDAAGATWNFTYASDGSSGVDANNRLTQARATISSVVNTQSWTYDARGNLLVNAMFAGSALQYRNISAQYDEADRAHQTSSERAGTPISNSAMNFDLSGRTTSMTVSQDGNTYNYVYAYYNDGREKSVSVSGQTHGNSTSTYNGAKQLVRVDLGQASGMDHAEFRLMVSDNEGHILYSEHNDGNSNTPEKRAFLYANGQPVGEIGTDTNAAMHIALDSPDSSSPRDYGMVRDTNSSYTADGKSQVRAVPGGNIGYTVRSGDTLESIAGAIYGNPSLWFAIADANGLGRTDNLREGTQLKVPATAQTGTITAKNHSVYNDGAITDSSLPNLQSPPPKSNKCAVIAAIIVIVVVAIVVAVVTVGIAAPASAALVGAAASIGVSSAVATTAITVATFAVVGAAVAATASVLRQKLFVEVGWQKRSDDALGIEWGWKGVAGDGVVGGLSGAAQGFGASAKALAEAGRLSNSAATWIRVGSAIAGAAGGYLSNAFRDDDPRIFTWSSLASAAVGGLAGVNSANAAISDASAMQAARGAVVGTALAQNVAGGAAQASKVLGDVATLGNYLAPWVRLGGTYLDHGRLKPSDWAAAVGGTLSEAVAQYGPKADGIGGKLAEHAMDVGASLVAAGVVGLRMNKTYENEEYLHNWIAQSIGKEAGQFIYEGALWAGNGIWQSIQRGISQRNAAAGQAAGRAAYLASRQAGGPLPTSLFVPGYYGADGAPMDAYEQGPLLKTGSETPTMYGRTLESLGRGYTGTYNNIQGFIPVEGVYNPRLEANLMEVEYGGETRLGTLDLRVMKLPPGPRSVGPSAHDLLMGELRNYGPASEISALEAELTQYQFDAATSAEMQAADAADAAAQPWDDGPRFEPGDPGPRLLSPFRSDKSWGDILFDPLNTTFETAFDPNVINPFTLATNFGAGIVHGIYGPIANLVEMGADTVHAAMYIPYDLIARATGLPHEDNPRWLSPQANAIWKGDGSFWDTTKTAASGLPLVGIPHAIAGVYHDIERGDWNQAAFDVPNIVMGIRQVAKYGAKNGVFRAPPAAAGAAAGPLETTEISETWRDDAANGRGMHAGHLNSGRDFSWSREDLAEIHAQNRHFQELGLKQSEIPLEWYDPNWRGGPPAEEFVNPHVNDAAPTANPWVEFNIQGFKSYRPNGTDKVAIPVGKDGAVHLLTPERVYTYRGDVVAYELGPEQAALYKSLHSAFKQALSDKAQAQGKPSIDGSVAIRPLDFYASTRMLVTPDGQGGLVIGLGKGGVPKGYLGSVFSNTGARDPSLSQAQGVRGLMSLGRELGVNQFSAFDTNLPQLYNRFGYSTVAKAPFGIAEGLLQGWDPAGFKAYNNGRPDFLYFVKEPDPSIVRPYQELNAEGKIPWFETDDAAHAHQLDELGLRGLLEGDGHH